MALLNFLKKPEEEKKEAKENKPVLEKKEKKQNPTPKALVSPHITEKATNLNEENKYVFKIQPKANKIEVKNAIESFYGVDVIDVRIINIPRKKKKTGRATGWVKGYKKSIVKIKEGQKIEISSH